jgi:CheY-like chemotaxis protein
MELLINEMIKRGATRSTMEAKVFGGGAVISGMNTINVGERNTAFVLDYLRTERITVVSKDVMDIYPRKVCFLPASGKAMVKRLASTNTGCWWRRRRPPRAPLRRWPVAAARSTCSDPARREFGKLHVKITRGGGRRFGPGARPAGRDHQPSADMTCVGAAADPLVAREMIRNLNPDVITLDVEMPRMDGIDFLSRLMRLRPMPVVMVSTLTERGAEVTLKALELGAVDFVAKPKIGIADGLRQLGEDITDKIRTAAKATVRRLAAPARRLQRRRRARRPHPAPSPIGRLSTEKIIFIGASTGGTEATREVLVRCPPTRRR